MAEECTQITSLCLTNCYSISDSSVYWIVECLPNLRTLYLIQCDLTSASILKIALPCTYLVDFNVSEIENLTDTEKEILMITFVFYYPNLSKGKMFDWWLSILLSHIYSYDNIVTEIILKRRGFG